MATTRTPIGRRPTAKITPEAVELFKRVLAIEASGDDQFWAAEGGRREEYVAACTALHKMLGLEIWDITVFDAAGTPSKEDRDHGWDRAAVLRKALLAEAERTAAP
jgi:hypothetical protein